MDQEMDKIGLDVKSLEKELSHLKALLDDAIICLKNVTRNDITELKTFATPPEVVQKVIISVALIMGEKGDFTTARTVIQDMGLIAKLSGIDPREIPEENVEALNQIVKSPDYDPQNVAESATSAKYLCLWSLAIHRYLSYFYKMKPKIDALDSVRKNYEKMKQEIRSLEEDLLEKRKNLGEYENKKVAAEKEHKELVDKRENTRKKLDVLNNLQEYLKPHFSNWEEDYKKLDDRLLVVTGNSLLSGACIEYFGLLENSYRKKLITGWQKILSTIGIKTSANFKLHEFVVPKQEVYSWELSGLPTSSVNLENATIMKYNQKAKVIFDPNDTCLTWMKQQRNSKGGKEILISSVADTNLSSKLQQALEKGLNLIIDFFNGDLDGILSYLLNPTLATVEGQKTIRIEDMWYNYDDGFDFFLVTRDKRVLSKREVQIKCCLIKFSLDADGKSKSIRSLLSKIFDEERQLKLIEQEQLLLEKKQQVSSNKDSILRKLNMSTDDAILEDHEYLEVLKEYQLVNAKVEKEMLEEASRIHINSFDRTPIDPLISALMDMFSTLERFSVHETYLQFSMNHFLIITSRIVANMNIKSIDGFTKDHCLQVIAKVYNLVTAGALLETKLFILIDICVSISKIYNQFRSDVWNYVISPKRSITANEGEDTNLEPSIWQSLKNLQSMIPGLQMDHLPSLVSSFNRIPEIGILGAVKLATAKIGHLTSLEKLALCISFLPDNFNLCLEIFSDDVLPGTIRKEVPIEDILDMCHYDQPIIYMQHYSFDYMELGSKISEKLKTTSHVIYCGNSNWEQIKAKLDKALTDGTVIILSEFNLFPEIHEQTSRYMRELENFYMTKSPKFRLIISTKPTDNRMSVELISMAVKVMNTGEDRSHSGEAAGALVPYLNLIQPDLFKGCTISLQNMVIHTIFTCFVVATRAKYAQQGRPSTNIAGFFETPVLSDTDLRIVASLLNSLAKCRTNIDGLEAEEVEMFANKFLWNSIAYQMDYGVVAWYMNNGFLSDNRPGFYLK
jgi:ATP-binding dynein motor region/Microtubule-binding stalk of dynein motor